MSRKDYIVIAETLTRIPAATREQVVDLFCAALTRSYDNFKARHFRQYIAQNAAD